MKRSVREEGQDNVTVALAVEVGGSAPIIGVVGIVLRISRFSSALSRPLLIPSRTAGESDDPYHSSFKSAALPFRSYLHGSGHAKRCAIR